MKKIAILNLMVMVLFVACTKEKAAISLKGEWNLESVITKQYRNGVLANTNTESGGGYRYNFQENGSLLITGFLVGLTVPYTILPDSKVDIDGDVFEVRDLTNSNATLFIRVDYTLDQYDEEYLKLKR